MSGWRGCIRLSAILSCARRRDFWAPVEPRYAEIARVMFVNNEWIVPRINGDIYTDKPILFFWIVIIASKIAGHVDEWTVRLPAALRGIGFVFATYLLGRDFFSRRVGTVAALAVASCVRVIWESRWAHVDMLFGCFFSFALYFGARTLLGRGGINEILFGYAFAALATLTKGLIGVVLPALVFLSMMVVRREWKMVNAAKMQWAIPVFLLIAGPWFYAVNRATAGTWLSNFILIHHVQRYTATAGHEQPFYYYFTTLARAVIRFRSRIAGFNATVWISAKVITGLIGGAFFAAAFLDSIRYNRRKKGFKMRSWRRASFK